MAVDLVLNTSKERPSVVDECDDISSSVVGIVGRFDQFTSNLQHHFVRKQVFVQISSLHFVLSEFVHITGVVRKIFYVLELGNRVVLYGILKHLKVGGYDL